MKYGIHRVIEPKGVFPQAAYKLDNNTKTIYPDEILIDVQTLNIDSASFTQIKNSVQSTNPSDLNKSISDKIMEIVGERGKMHNPVTGSGGMLIGTVSKLGSNYGKEYALKEGDRIATLVSLTLTPLNLYEIKGLKGEQIDVRGEAILFESGIYAKLPSDMSDKLALAALDVAGAAPQADRLVKEGDCVFVMGGGKSGMLCMYAAKQKVGSEGKVIALTHSDASTAKIKGLGYADIVIQANAQDPVDVLNKIEKETGGSLCDVVLNVVNVPDTEMASIASAKDDGIVYFFSMATSFTKAALGAEGIGKDVTMIIGNGYTKGHADYTLDILRSSKKLMEEFKKII